MGLTATCQAKLTRAGFTIICHRIEPTSTQSQQTYSVWRKTKDKPEWHLLEKGFITKASLKRFLKKLIEDSMCIDLYDSYHRV
jgi:hypothetical protein